MERICHLVESVLTRLITTNPAEFDVEHAMNQTIGWFALVVTRGQGAVRAWKSTHPKEWAVLFLDLGDGR